MTLQSAGEYMSRFLEGVEEVSLKGIFRLSELSVSKTKTEFIDVEFDHTYELPLPLQQCVFPAFDIVGFGDMGRVI